MEELNHKNWEYKTQVHMNKPMKFMGLSSTQLFITAGSFGFVMVICISVLKVSVLVPFFIDSVFFVPVYFISKKLAKEHKKGNSTYLGSYLAFTSTPKKIIDKNKIFSFIVNE
jgi:hypothetical protein